MKCSFCGHELEPGSNFCPECGTMMSVDDDFSNASVSEEQKYEPDSADAYSKDVIEEDVHETESTEEEMSVPEYVPHIEGAFEDYNTIRRNEEEAEAALAAAAAENEAAARAEEEEDDPFAELHQDYEPAPAKKTEPVESEPSFDDDDMYVKPSKSKKGGVTIAVLTVVLIAVIVVGVNAVRSNGGDILSVFKRTTSGDTTASTENTSGTTESKSSTTKKDEKSTTDKTTKESTTDKDKTTTEKKSTTESTTKGANTSESTTSKPSASQNTTESTTRAYTTTTRAYTTTTRAYTTETRPQTTYTSPATTSSPKPTSESLQKPSKYYSSPLTRYASVNGVSVRLRPSSSSTVRASLSVGGEVKVYAEENGYYYVYYARYGVYGWVNGSYLSKERPVAENEVKVSGVVKPDKTYSNPETKTVTTSEGLRLRKGPGTNYDTIRYLGKGYPVSVKGTSSKNPGWVYVTDITRGVSGWVSSAYIK